MKSDVCNMINGNGCGGAFCSQASGWDKFVSNKTESASSVNKQIFGQKGRIKSLRTGINSEVMFLMLACAASTLRSVRG